MNALRLIRHRSLAAACWLGLVSACGGGSGAPEPRLTDLPGPSSTPTPPPPEFVLHGEVFSFDHGMLADADVGIFVTTPTMGYSYWWANGRLTTDSLGLFTAEVPESVIDIYAAKDGFVQPCAYRSSVTESTPDGDPIRIELQHVSEFRGDFSPLPQTASEPSVTGHVYASTPNGDEPVDGAILWAEWPLGIVYATTVSSRLGGFYLCHLPPDAVIDVVKEGYKGTSIGPLDWTQPVQVNIKLEPE